MSEKQKTSLVWFRKNLRIRDNLPLKQAIKSGNRVIGFYALDPSYVKRDQFGFKKMDRYRSKFLLESLDDLKKGLHELNISLILVLNAPEIELPELSITYEIDEIYLQEEWTSEEKEKEQAVRTAISKEIKWFSYKDQFLLSPDDLPFPIESLPQSFTEYRRNCEKLVLARGATKPPEPLESSNILVNKDWKVPEMEDLEMKLPELDSRSAFPFSGGETCAWERLKNYFWESTGLRYYKLTRNGLLGTDYSSKLSAWLALGCISARSIYDEILRFEKEVVANESTYWLKFELLWRDFFYFTSLKHGNKIFRSAGIGTKNHHWNYEKDLVTRWVTGKTSEPFVNANMLELKATGWMSNRGRQNVASFFTKEWNLDWRIGAAYFESMLIDYDVHNNYCNWMYVAGVGNDPRNRKFDISSQAKHYDPNGRYQRTWLQQTLF